MLESLGTRLAFFFGFVEESNIQNQQHQWPKKQTSNSKYNLPELAIT
jgi:hypothetical protein